MYFCVCGGVSGERQAYRMRACVCVARCNFTQGGGGADELQVEVRSLERRKNFCYLLLFVHADLCNLVHQSPLLI